MRTIWKGKEPASLTKHRKTPYSYYDNLSVAAKNELRNTLVREQRGLCCYCMSRIHPDRQSMKIEHWQSRRYHQSEQLNFRNLIGACLGGEGQRDSQQHCDTKKDDKALKWNPAEPAHRIESRVRFDSDGTIRAGDAKFDHQLDDVLGLNVARLRNNRQSVITAIALWWRRNLPIRDRAARDRLVLRTRSRYVNGDEDLPEYCQVAVHWLDKRLSNRAS